MSLATTYASKKESFYWLNQGEEQVLLLPPVLDENFQFPKESPRLSQVIVVDAAKVRHISSAWAALFVRWHRRLSPEQQFVFRNCPRKMVDLMNFVSGFLPAKATVESFIAPYECTSCQYEDSEVMRRGIHYLEPFKGAEAILRVPFQLNCPKCPGMMEFAVLENIYLKFLNSTYEY